MDIAGVGPLPISVHPPPQGVHGARPSTTEAAAGHASSQTLPERDAVKEEAAKAEAQKAEKVERTPDRKELGEAAEAMNAVMDALNTSVTFRLHEKTKVLMMELVDKRSNEVIKELPPKTFLDMVAKLRETLEAVGTLLDSTG